MIDVILAGKDLDRTALQDMLLEFYELQISRAGAVVAAAITPEMAVQDFWDDFDEYFVPNGATTLAYDENCELIGMGMMRKIRSDAAEFKRMYVRPQARGHGIGRKMIALRLEVAKELGVKMILVETLKASTAMHAIYRDLGFKEIPRYPESHAAVHFPVVANELIYFQRDL
ncbi:GNAT family N-acetyltransferase [Yoonia sp.]|uniref:GNAT family N-acetyltransferase n=1 Tax=Yoonia sp. TaxID=2212373 RepID=UPI0035C7D5F8